MIPNRARVCAKQAGAPFLAIILRRD